MREDQDGAPTDATSHLPHFLTSDLSTLLTHANSAVTADPFTNSRGWFR